MKLIECRAINFGTLKNFSFKFNDGLTAVCEKNGFGKTTLASFIKAMFYGLPQINANAKKTLDENERKKYYPWDGGVFGGSLDFEANGKQYRIERFFGKTAKEDEFRLIDLSTGQISTDYTEKIGIELFGIDAESFCNSIFFSQGELKGGITPMISAKLNDLSDAENDLGEYEKALDTLEKRRKYYEAGQSGVIPVTESKIAAAEVEVADGIAAAGTLREISAIISEKEAESEKLKGKIAEVRQKIDLFAEQSAALERKKNADKLRAELEECRTKLSGFAEKYPNGFPKKEELVCIRSVINERNMLVAAIGALESDYNDYLDGRRVYNAYFAGGVPSDDDIAACRDDINTYNEKMQKASELRKTVDGGAEGVGGVSRLKVLTVLFAVLTALGIGISVFSAYVGIAVATAGAVLTGIFAFKTYKTSTAVKNARENADRITEECKEAEMEAEAAISNARAFTENYTAKDPKEAVIEIYENAVAFKKLLQSEEKFEKYADDIRKKSALDSEITEFFAKFGLDPLRETEEADRLGAELDEAKRLEETVLKCTKQLNETKEETVPEILESLDELKASEEELNNAFESVAAELRDLGGRIPLLTSKTEGLTEAEERLDALCQEKAVYVKNVTAIKTAAELLRKARETLVGRYSSVILSGFNKYAEKLFSGHGTVRIDAELNVTVECDGSIRDSEVFSRGLRDIITLCLKLSLSDALYKDEKPLLILDDPFVNSDDERMGFALETVKQLATERQIVYLTCHTGRMP